MLCAVDYIEMYVSNIFQAAYFYQKALGFNKTAIDSHIPGKLSLQLEQGQAKFILTSSSESSSLITEHINRHGDGVKDIAFIVEDIDRLYAKAIQYGAVSVASPLQLDTKRGKICQATIQTFGNTVHTLTQYLDSAPSCQSINASEDNRSLLNKFDHIAVCVEQGEVDKWVEFYREVFGFAISHEEMVDTGKSGMNSKATEHSESGVKIVFTEPSPKYERSQTREYLNAYNGPGVQHIAFATDDIIASMQHLTAEGIEFLNIPDDYYTLRAKEYPDLQELITSIQTVKALIDRDERGILLQAFSKPLQTRATFFIEVIQRLGAEGFGSGNIKALFKAVEMEQVKRGKL